jgi:hypothetical protein
MSPNCKKVKVKFSVMLVATLVGGTGGKGRLPKTVTIPKPAIILY